MVCERLYHLWKWTAWKLHQCRQFATAPLSMELDNMKFHQPQNRIRASKNPTLNEPLPPRSLLNPKGIIITIFLVNQRCKQKKETKYVHEDPNSQPHHYQW